MNYVVFDLEFNQNCDDINKDKVQSEPSCPFEIIQIGAVKLDNHLQLISSFDRQIKPEVFSTIHPYVKKITGLTMDKLHRAETFKKVYMEFINFIDESSSILCVWGMTDLKELFRNIRYHKLDASLVPKKYINLQSYASRYFACPKGTNIGLRNAVELFDITINHNFHNALNDAYYTAEVFKKINTQEMMPQTYNPHKTQRNNLLKNMRSKVNTAELIKQFEKMFGRKMTEDEKAIIELAYLMGKTNQFQEKIEK